MLSNQKTMLLLLIPASANGGRFEGRGNDQLLLSYFDPKHPEGSVYFDY